MRATFRIRLKSKGSKQQYLEGEEPGVIAFQDVVYDLPEADYKKPKFIASLNDQISRFFEENFEMTTEEVEDEG